MAERLKRVLDPLLPVDRFTKADRRIVLTIWTAGLVQGFAQAQTSASLPFTRAGLGLSEGEMSLLLGLARLGGFLALPLAWLADRHGRRRPFLVAVCLIVAGGSIAGLSQEAWHFGVSHAVLRTGTAAISGLALVILAETVSKSIRAYAISFYGAAVSLGSGLALTALPLADGGSQAWRIPHLFIALGCLLVPALIRRVPETRVYERDPGEAKWTDLASGEWASRFWVIVAVGFLSSAYGTFGTTFTTERLTTHVGLSIGATVLVVLAAGTIGGIGFFIGGHLADAWGRRTTSVVCIVLGVVGGITLYTATALPLIVAGAFVSSFATFAFVPAGGSHRAELFPTALRSTATTASANAALVGSAAGLLLGVVTIDTLGLSTTMLFLAVGMVAAAALTLRLPETRGQDLTAVSSDGA